MIYKTNKNIITVMKKIISMVCACLLALSAQATDIKKYDALYENLPFQMEKVTRPQFPANEVNLKDFGAIGDGSSLCATAFAKAIDALTQKGGGKLIVPQGVWFTGPIVLKSNINLHSCSSPGQDRHHSERMKGCGPIHLL